MTIRINRSHAISGDANLAKALRTLAQSVVKISVTGPLNGVTDNGGQTAGTAIKMVGASVDVAASGSNLAGKASLETALGTVKNAIATLYTKANELAAAVNLPVITYNGGGTDGAGTVAAITVAVTGATTGASAANFGALVTAYNKAIYNLAVLVNKVGEASGDGVASFNFNGTIPPGVLATIPALSTDSGTAVAPAVTKVAADAALLDMAKNLALVSAKINAITTAGKPQVLAVA